MFVSKTALHSKNEILIYLLVIMMVEGFIDPQDVKNRFNITSLSLYRYISFIKTMLADYSMYYIDLYYSKQSKKYICKCYVEFNSQSLH